MERSDACFASGVLRNESVVNAPCGNGGNGDSAARGNSVVGEGGNGDSAARGNSVVSASCGSPYSAACDLRPIGGDSATHDFGVSTGDSGGCAESS